MDVGSRGEICIAELLQSHDANVHRVRADRNGAGRLRALERSVAQMVRQGDKAGLPWTPNPGGRRKPESCA